MNNHIKTLEERLRGLFETKANEFSKFAEEDPARAVVTTQLAGLYRDLAEAMTR